MKTPLIHSPSIHTRVSHACVVTLLTVLAGCAHAPKEYSSASLQIIPASDVPAHITTPMAIRTVAPLYPYELRRLGLTGSAQVVCLIDEIGTAQNVACLSATHYDFAGSAVSAAQKWSFAPGTLNGRRVAMRVLIPFLFTFNEDERELTADERLSLR